MGVTFDIPETVMTSLQGRGGDVEECLRLELACALYQRELASFGGTAEGGQFALIERTSQLKAQAFFDIAPPSLKGCHHRLGNIKRHTHAGKLSPAWFRFKPQSYS